MPRTVLESIKTQAFRGIYYTGFWHSLSWQIGEVDVNCLLDGNMVKEDIAAVGRRAFESIFEV